MRHLNIVLPFLLAGLILFPAPVKASDIHDAAQRGDLPEVQRLLAAAPDRIEEIDADGATPLILAVQAGNAELCRWLIGEGAAVGSVDDAGDTPLHHAALGGSAEIVDLLLAHGADPDPADDLGYRPLILAVFGGHGDVARTLLARGADPDPECAMGLGPLALAARRGDTELVRLLLAGGADPDRRDAFGRLPLWEAEKAGREEAAAVLRAAGASDDYEIGKPEITRLAADCVTVAVPFVNHSRSTALATGEGLIVVDTAQIPAVPGLEEGYASLGGGPIRFIVHTHLHADHTAGDAAIGGDPVVVDFAHLDSLAAAGVLSHGTDETRGPGGRTLPAPYILRLGGREVRIIPYPGMHSDSDELVYLPGPGVLCMGSLLLSESFPPIRSGSVDRYVDLLDAVLEIFPAGTRFVPGHGRPIGRDELRAYRDMVAATVAAVRATPARGDDPYSAAAVALPTGSARYGECAFLPYITTRSWIKTIRLDGARGR